MYLRLVQTRVDQKHLEAMRDRYAREIVPALRTTDGCLHAGLWQSVTQEEQMVSLTLWESKEHAEAYEQSGTYQQLLALARPLFAEVGEWKLQLSEDLRLEYGPDTAEPEVLGYDQVHDATPGAGAPLHDVCPIFRIVSMLVAQGKAGEFRELYRTQIVPILRRVPGCCHIQLAQSSRQPAEFISFTIWKDAAAVEAYERSGLFTELRRKLAPALSALYQWKLVQEERSPGVVTSDDSSVHAYRLIFGESFRS
jgi:quinol monooxygenase YgiN